MCPTLDLFSHQPPHKEHDPPHSTTTRHELRKLQIIHSMTIRCFDIALHVYQTNHAIGWNRSRNLFQPIAWFVTPAHWPFREPRALIYRQSDEHINTRTLCGPLWWPPSKTSASFTAVMLEAFQWRSQNVSRWCREVLSSRMVLHVFLAEF